VNKSVVASYKSVTDKLKGFPAMPFVSIRQAAGRSSDQKEAVIAGITRVISESFDVPASDVTVMFFELEPENWGRGGVMHARKRDHPIGGVGGA